MEEALPEVVLGDSAVNAWLGASDSVVHAFVVKTAANLVGSDVLEAMSSAYEAEGKLPEAGFRLVSAGYTDAIDGMMSAEKEGNRQKELFLLAATLFDQACEDQDRARTRPVQANCFGYLLVNNMADLSFRPI